METTKQHFHREESSQRFQHDLIATHGKIRTLRQGIAEIPGQIGILKISRARRAHRPQYGPGIVSIPGGQFGQGFPQGRKKGCYSMNVRVPHDIRKKARGQHTVF